MTKGRLFSNSIFYTLIGFFPMALGFFTMPIMTRYLTPEDYGVLALIATFTQALAVLASFQLYVAVNRFYFDYDENLKNTYFSTLFYAVVLISFLVFISLCLWGDIVVRVVFQSAPSFFPYFLVASVNVSFALLMGITTAFLKVEQRAKEMLETSFVATLVSVALSIYLVVVEGMGVLGGLIGTLSTTLIIVFLHIYKLRSKFLMAFDYSMLASNFRFGLPVIPHALGGYLFMYSDKIILDKHVGLAMIGVYSIADRFASLYKTVVNSFGSAFDPVFMQTCKKSVEDGQNLVNKVSETWFVVLGLGYYLLSNFGEYLVYLMTPREYHEAAMIIPILSLAYLLRGVYILPINTFYYMKKTKYLPYATIASGVLNVILNMLTIPYIGIYGAAVTTVFSFAFNLWAINMLTRYTFRVKFNLEASATLVGIVILSNAIFYLIPFENHLLRVSIQIMGFISISTLLIIFNIGKTKTYVLKGLSNAKSLYNS